MTGAVKWDKHDIFSPQRLTPSGLARSSHLESLWAECRMTVICPAGICRVRRSSDCRGREFFRSLNFFDATRITRYNAQSIFGQVAQLVEQRTENPRVGSSILPLATIFKSPNSFRAFSRLPAAPVLAGLRGFASRAAPPTFPRFWPSLASLLSVFI